MDATLNLSKLAKHFSDETAARELLESMRWPNGPECPICAQTSTVYLMQKMAELGCDKLVTGHYARIRHRDGKAQGDDPGRGRARTPQKAQQRGSCHQPADPRDLQ